MTGIPFLVAVIVFLLFGIATDQHHGKRLRRACPKRRAIVLRSAAWGGVALDFVVSRAVWGSMFGPIGWVGALMIGAAVAFCLFNFVPLRKPFLY